MEKKKPEDSKEKPPLKRVLKVHIEHALDMYFICTFCLRRQEPFAKVNIMLDVQALTTNEERILRYIEKYVIQKGLPPSNSEIHAHFGFRSKTSTRQYLKALAQKGFIDWSEGDYRKRNLKLKKPTSKRETRPSGLISVPLEGSIAAGLLNEAVPNREELLLPEGFLDGRFRYFALTVRGNSMIGDHIVDGDLVVLKAGPEFKNGDIVAVDLGGETTLKRIYRKDKKVELRASNPEFDPIIIQNAPQFRILGTLSHVIRKA
jgi:repressor LexA